MIKKNFVFILGAGASKDVGYPSGSELKDAIIKNLGPQQHRNQISKNYGFSEELIINFCTSLVRSGRYSVDAFLEYRPEFLEIGKFAIAYELLPHEKVNELFSPSNNWYQYIFEKMNCGFNDFGKNKIQFITFNYDRSLETFFFYALKNSFGKTDIEVAEELNQIEIIHVHGQMGFLPWQNKEVEKTRKYSRDINIENTLKIASKGIKIIHEATEDDPEFQKTREIFSKSDSIIFLGFGYNKKNIERLKIDLKRKDIWGSSYGKSRKEMEVINSQLFLGRLKFFPVPQDCLSYLRNQISFI